MRTGEYRLIAECRGCHAPEAGFVELLLMTPMPLSGGFCLSQIEAIASPKFPLSWIRCSRCFLVQVREDVPDVALYSQYNYASSTVPGLVKHFVEYANFLRKRYLSLPALRFLEIGCNDGVLLNRLPPVWQLDGVDPSDVARTAAAQQAHYTFWNVPFTHELVHTNHWENTFDVISGSNCLAHISDLKAVFEAVYAALRPGGHFWLEVHDLSALLNGLQWDTIYHEHKVEWSEISLIRCLAPLGFAHCETHRLSLHGGLLRVCFSKNYADQIKPPLPVGEEEGITDLRRAYETRYEAPAARKLKEVQEKGGIIAAYGAAGRATVYLNQMSELKFCCIVDESPLRLNKFVPGVGIPIVPPPWLTEKQVDHCLITAWNYKDDILRKNSDFDGHWLTAFPIEPCGS